MMTVLRLIYRRVPGLLTVVPLIGLWEIAGRSGLFFVLPPFSDILAEAWKLIVSGRIAEHAGGTFRSLSIGLAISVVAGLTLGVAMGRSRLMEQVFGIYVDVLMSAPVSAIVPILVLIFGTGRESIIAAVVLFSFFVVVVNTYTGVREVNEELIEMARSFGCSEVTLLRRVIMPGALPLTLTGLRLGIGRSFNGAVFGEMIISVVGLGGLLLTFGSRFQFAQLYALVIFIIALAVIAMMLFERLERRLLSGRFAPAYDDQ